MDEMLQPRWRIFRHISSGLAPRPNHDCRLVLGQAFVRLNARDAARQAPDLNRSFAEPYARIGDRFFVAAEGKLQGRRNDPPLVAQLIEPVGLSRTWRIHDIPFGDGSR